MIQRIDHALGLIPKWLETVRRPASPYGRYRYFASSPKNWCIYASIEGIIIENHLGMAAKWTEKQRHEVLDGLRNCQAPDGYFRCPCCSNEDGDPRQRCSEDNADGITYKAAVTLYSFGVKPRYPLPTGKVAVTFNSVDSLLRNTFERENPYSAGSTVWKICGMRSLSILSQGKDPVSDPIVAAIIDWLVKNQDPETGLWFHRGDLLNGVNGLLKLRFGTFDLAGIEIPRPERIVSTILKIQKEDGSFGGACCDWNAVGLLAEIGRRIPQYRNEIIEAYRRILPVILAKQKDGGWFCWSGIPNEEPSLKSTYINLLGLLSIKYFLLEDNENIDRVFSDLKNFRKSLLR